MFESTQLVDRPELVWLVLGTVFMFLGMSYFIVRGTSRAETPEQKEYYVVTILIAAIAFASYLSMVFGMGLTEITLVNGEVLDIYWARYADWLFTTPLLLLDLAILADADRSTIGALVGVDALMIVTGLAGGLSTTPVFRYVWWTVSTFAMIAVLYMLWTTLTSRAEALGGDTERVFKLLRNLTVVLWTFYPIVWILGTEGVGVVPLFLETLFFMVLDVTAKIGFGFILLRSRAVTGTTNTADEPATATEE